MIARIVPNRVRENIKFFGQCTIRARLIDGWRNTKLNSNQILKPPSNMTRKTGAIFIRENVPKMKPSMVV